jgi:CubicO group peptidase (beta-lactamase class C family)
MITLRLLIFIFIIAVFGTSYSFGDIKKNEPPQSIEELQVRLENILKDMHVPGMSIAIVSREGPEWIAGLGSADLANNQAATATTLFRIGSVSKGFVSLAILMLVHEGQLRLEDPVQKLAPEVWFDNQWEESDPIRIVHLLENTTGWDDMHLREFAKTRSSMSSLEALNYDHSSRSSRWRPGTRMSYCNSGPAVAAYIVEKITGKNFEAYIEEKFFKPIGMPTATYFQPLLEASTRLYHSDGETPHHYWDLLYPAIGAINACANDMANYLLFYLNHGHVQGLPVMPAHLFNRLEVPFSTWAAKEGLRVGYGLGNYWAIHDGFIYHGHDGNVPGGLAVLAYMPEEGMGYFYSLNSENRQALKDVGTAVRAYITRSLQKTFIPPVTSLSEKAKTFAGWYEPNSPRMQLSFFLERLVGLTYVHFQDNKLLMTSLDEKQANFFPVTDTDFLYFPVNESPDPVPTLKLLTPSSEKQFFQRSFGDRNAAFLHVTMMRIPTWLAIFEITITGFVLLAFMSTLLSAPFWIWQALRKKYLHPVEHSMLLWPQRFPLSIF